MTIPYLDESKGFGTILMAKIYDRIPVILKQRDQTTWLGVSRLPDQGAGQGDLLATLQPYLAGMKL